MRSRQRTRTVPRVVLLGLALALCACAPKAIGARGPHRRRIAEVLRWVRDEVTFAGLEGFAPRPLRRVVAEGEADDYEKNLLLLFALEKRGVEAHFALIRPKDYGALDPKLPLPRQLKEALVFVPRQQGLSEPLWIAAHCHHCELGQLPLPMRDQPALLIKAVPPDVTRPPTIADTAAPDVARDMGQPADQAVTPDVIGECLPSSFPPFKPGQIMWRWIGQTTTVKPCPVAAGAWTTAKLFKNGTGELAKYCLYEWPVGGEPLLCGLPYDGSIPPWEWIEPDSGM